jgi:hypothetical protein
VSEIGPEISLIDRNSAGILKNFYSAQLGSEVSSEEKRGIELDQNQRI